MKNLIFLMLLLISSSLLFTSCAKEEAIEEAIETEVIETYIVNSPRGMSEEEAAEWAESLSYDDVVSLAVESQVGTSRWCSNWGGWSTYSSWASCSGCSGYAKARHTLRQKRSRVCCNSSYCQSYFQYRTRYVCRTYC